MDKSISCRQIELNTNQASVRLFVIAEQLYNNSISLSFNGNFCLSARRQYTQSFPQKKIQSVREQCFSVHNGFYEFGPKCHAKISMLQQWHRKLHTTDFPFHIITIANRTHTHAKSDDSEKQIERRKKRKEGKKHRTKLCGIINNICV